LALLAPGQASVGVTSGTSCRQLVRLWPAGCLNVEVEEEASSFGRRNARWSCLGASSGAEMAQSFGLMWTTG
jgi:hypothetical protein